MQPVLNKNDLIFVKKCEIEEIKENDIITFKKNEDTVVTHRIVGIIEDINGTSFFITKGDNNEVRDDYETEFEQIYGKVVFHLPKIGKVVEYIQNISGFVNALIIILIIYIFNNIKAKKKGIRKTKRRKYEIKKLRDNYNIKEEI